MLLAEFHYAARRLAKSPGFTFVAVITLALGIGGNTAIFTVIDAVLLNPLPVRDPGKLVLLLKTFPKTHAPQSTSYPDYLEWEKAESFETMAACYGASFSITGQGEAEQLTGFRVSHDFFRLLGVKPILGRPFVAEEDMPDQARSVILGEGLWKRRFGGRDDVIGKHVTLNGDTFSIVGVMPRSFRFPPATELWAPLAVDRQNGYPGNHFLVAIGRLKRDATIETAQAEMNTIAARMADIDPDHNRGWGVFMIPVTRSLNGQARPALLVLMSAVALVLLIACMNVANLLLVRGAARSKEIAVRTALGASRGRVIRLVMAESLILAFAGGALGLLFAVWSTHGLAVLISPVNISPDAVQVNASVLLFTLAVSLFTGFAFGLIPSLRLSRGRAVHETLKEEERMALGGTKRRRTRSVLVVAEVALALVLLVGAALLARSFHMLSKVSPGFQPANTLALDLSPTEAKYPKPVEVQQFYVRLLERLRALPGVVEVGAVDILPFSGRNTNRAILVEANPAQSGQWTTSNLRVATPGYLRTLRVTLSRGRHFRDSDKLGSPSVAIINERMAKTLWPGQDAIGRRFSLSGETGPWTEVIGISRDVKHFGLRADVIPEMILPYSQSPAYRMSVVLRTTGDAAILADAVRAEVHALDPDLPVSRMQTMDSSLSQSLTPERSSALLLGLFAGFALLLAVIGLYGVISYSVQQRTHELGVRMALGAAAADLMRMVVGQAVRLAVIGTAIGTIGAFAAVGLLSSVLFGVEPRDPAVFLFVPAVLLVVTCVAGYIPARHALRANPIVALRHQ